MKHLVKFAILAAVVAMPMFATTEASPVDTTAQIQRAEGYRLIYKEGEGMGHREEADREGTDSLNPENPNG
ncbi:MAG: hypothetical protein IJR37_01115 [Schwartzia sp.]|nr:hypothetical protein [Schwartzia sp. (in: firmicutes)]